ncbi:hypothetical protein FIBSPDRAFT_23810 [Athelia psychrophila]|uniref:Uncharacterized protein n=1 Tax=Athelia psychrophila TaxID=1759441 RepID=A0A166GCV4_9AGAM|nr:hypothetical protein FIBSPDRAFT_23810 [Fibularhizoctonia sp. CBS 109695]
MMRRTTTSWMRARRHHRPGVCQGLIARHQLGAWREETVCVFPGIKRTLGSIPSAADCYPAATSCANLPTPTPPWPGSALYIPRLSASPPMARYPRIGSPGPAHSCYSCSP